MLNDTVLAELKAVTGAQGWIENPDALEPYLREWRGLYRGRTPLMLMPATTAEAAAVLRLCSRHGIGVVPQGGNTGLAGGAIPHSTPERPEILLSARRLNRIRAIDADNFTITAEAGCILANVQAAAREVGRLFPLSLASEGSCQLGGNISTNAGGTAVLRFGNMRDLVLGLEVVLPDGRVLDGLRGLRKDNTGYDLKQLFIGAEGTLGFVTAAVCKLYPEPRAYTTALLALKDPRAAVALHAEARARLGDGLVGFELLNRLSLELVLRHLPGRRDPFDTPHAWYVLLETADGGERGSAETAMEGLLEHALATGLVDDGVVAGSGPQRDALWALRHGVSEAQKLEGASIKHDVAVPISGVPRFIAEASRKAAALCPGVRVVAFGHLGDGNIHFNLGQPPDAGREDFLARWDEISGAVHEIAVGLGGTFSAEHGIGQLKTGELGRWRDGVELGLMRAVKAALDPQGIMNPGKVIPPPE